MHLLGKYGFDRLRDTLQGVFEFQDLTASNNNKPMFLLELWQIRFVLQEGSLEIFINMGKKGYVSFGKVNLTN